MYSYFIVRLALQPCLALLISANLAARPQQPSTGNSATVVKANVNEVLVPVVARDSKGQIVDNLTKQNFQVFDDGKLRVITGFQVVRHAFDANAKSTPSPPDGNDTPTGVRPVSATSRFVVFLFDDFNLSSSDLAQAQISITKVLEGSLLESATVAVLTTSGRNSGLTRDRAKLQKAVADLKASNLYRQDDRVCPRVDYYQGDLIVNKGDGTALKGATEDALACANLDPSMASVAAQMVQRAAEHAVALGERNYRTNLDFLKLIVSKMGALPGERVLIIVSSGFLTPSAEAMELKSQVVEMAARANVTINSINARGLYTTNVEASQTGGGSPLDARQKGQYLQASALSQENVMAELADGTGGSYFHNDNNLEAGFRDLISGPASVYLLAFSPAKVKSNGAYHALQVRANRDGVKLQARRGYFAPQGEETKK